MSEKRRKSPWAYDESGLECPHCHSTRINRVLDTWALKRGIQMYQCVACGKKFYTRDVDDYQPTFER